MLCFLAVGHLSVAAAWKKKKLNLDIYSLSGFWVSIGRMGTETMGSNGICGGGARKPFDELSRQGSLYNLTLDEVQRQLGDLGKPLSSMNLDELLNSVWVAEANQGQLTPTLPRQLSHKLSTDLTKKTVNEVWQDIQQGQIQKKKISDSRKASQERQPTLGEMTLEDFLVKAGIVAESSPSKKSQASAMVVAQPQQNLDPQEAQWMQYPIQQHVLMPGHYQVPVPANVVMDAGYPETQMTMSPTPLIGTLSDTHSIGRKRVASGDVIEKTVERRQKRMIKNRESAARSRERKQAYTHELENKVSRLEEENERLRRHKEEVTKVLACVAPPNPKYQLRRTTSAPF